MAHCVRSTPAMSPKAWPRGFGALRHRDPDRSDGRAGTIGPRYLNRATTQRGRFVNSPARGLPGLHVRQTAIARMAQLEEQALRKQGVDPRRWRSGGLCSGSWRPAANMTWGQETRIHQTQYPS
jgi:hypothetical protein